MDFRYYYDPDTDLPHVFNHGVSEEEVEQVFRASGEDLPGARNSRIKLGQTSAGRYLKIIYLPEESSNCVFIITAFELQGKAKAAFRRRRRRKPR